MLISAAFAARGANRPNAAGASSNCWKSFILGFLTKYPLIG
ncbi:hypothetical protein EV04_0610 [Prochlorococcus marinus str. LG]|nr:hypothetical protein EV04_0610 [Prochlorococcus marinus str. LG]KGG25107.1 hypothetical protein EV09_0001 [Prochlorococcus marinus str. SS35]